MRHFHPKVLQRASERSQPRVLPWLGSGDMVFDSLIPDYRDADDPANFYDVERNAVRGWPLMSVLTDSNSVYVTKFSTRGETEDHGALRRRNSGFESQQVDHQALLPSSNGQGYSFLN